MVLLLALGFGLPAKAQNTQADKHTFETTKALAEQGDPGAEFALGNLYFLGTGTRRDLVKAAKWHRKAAEQGLVEAQVRLAFDYLNGIGVKTDLIEANRWLRRAAEQGSADAQFELGHDYAVGSGVSENPVEAAAWYRRAAEQGFAAAEYALGDCYFEGEGVTKNTELGLGWIKKSAEQGYAPAQNRYGMCFTKAIGVQQDYVEAYKWFSLAAAQGGETALQAKIDLSMAERAMTPEQIDAGQKRAGEFIPRKAGQPTVPTTGIASASAINTGSVTVKADDDTADIYLDGLLMGNSPAKFTVTPGSHVIVVKKPGFKDSTRQLQVTAGAELSLHIVLEKE